MRTGSIRNGPGQRLAVLTAAVLVLVPAVMARTMLDFENLPPGTTVDDQFVRQGVRFRSAHLAADPAARSGTRALRPVSPSAEIFTPVPLVMAFVKPQARVKLFAMSPGVPRNGTLRVFDEAGAVIGQDGPKMVTADRYTTMFEVSVAGPRVRRAELQLEGAAHYAIDDLEFDDVPSGPPPTRITETRQPSVRDNAALIGKFPAGWEIGAPPEPASFSDKDPSEPGDTGEEREERFNLEFAPALERDLAPGATAQVSMKVAGHAGLAGSVRWIGTRAPLPVTLSVNGTRVATGKPYSLGTDRGGSDVGGVARRGGQARLSVRNTSGVRVRVRLNLGLVRGQEK